ncbi:4Fe-4S dicluster domain-containing protein [Candidatus Bipolaricaulota bacterium]|nr:4Fe-4S dicluster domain-containing protein [Candidatus Bipolaricaulota bacterium]
MPEGLETLEVGKLDPTFCDEVAAQPGGEHIRRCFACGTCVAGCPVSEVAPEYSPRKIIRQILFGMREEVLSSPLMWYCLVCYRCYARCPQNVNFTDVMRALRYLALKGNHAPPDVLAKVAELDRELQEDRTKKVRSAFEAELATFAEQRLKAEKTAEPPKEEPETEEAASDH